MLPAMPPVPEVKEEVPTVLPTLDKVEEKPQDVLKMESPSVAAPVVPEPVKEEIKTEPIPVTPVSVISSVSPVNQPEEPKLVVDGSKENNFWSAVGADSVSNDKVVSTETDDVQSLREFGTSDKVLESTTSVQQPVVTPEVSQVKTLTRSKGFASNKFFTVVAIILFLAACAFLGYEAFQYFTMK